MLTSALLRLCLTPMWWAITSFRKSARISLSRQVGSLPSVHSQQSPRGVLFLMVCLPHTLSAFLTRLEDFVGKNSLKVTFCTRPRAPHAQMKPPPHPYPQGCWVDCCLSMRPREVGRVSCERGVFFPVLVAPGKGQVLMEEIGTLVGGIQGATSSLKTALRGFQETG